MNKQKLICIILLFVLLFSLVSVSAKFAYAVGDPMTLTQISGLSYALGNSFGITYDMAGLTSLGASEFYENRINSWLSGRTIIEAFGEDQARIVAGKLVIPHMLYNGIRDFLQSFTQEQGIEQNFKDLYYNSGGYTYSYGGVVDYPGTTDKETICMYETNLSTGVTRTVLGGEFAKSSNYQFIFNGIWVESGYVKAFVTQNTSAGKYIQQLKLVGQRAGSTSTEIKAKLDGSIPETVLNPDQEWTGTIGGEDWPDTNLDQLIGQVFEDVADNNLDVDGEVGPIEPIPTPVPTVVPGDIDGYWNRQSEQLEGLGNDIGDISGQLDDLGEQVGDITDALEGVNQGIQSQTGVISGALDQAAQDVVDAIGEQTQTLDESLTATAEGVQEIADALNPPEIDEKTFDLRELFPFCIPFDIYHLLQKFDASPVAPHVQLPIVIGSIGFTYNLDLDFSVWDPVAAAMRTAELIVYALGLAWATSKVIKW